MFYQCPKCKKTWQFPLHKCAECFEPLQEVRSKTAKVIGISETTIPTASQIEVPYFVLVLKDENDNIWFKKSQKEYKIGEEFEEETGGDVAISKYKYNYKESVEELDRLLGGAFQGNKAFIMPSLNKVAHPYFRYNTSPEFLDALIIYLKEKGMETKVGAKGDNLEAMAHKGGILKICAKHQILPIDLEKEPLPESDIIFNLAPAHQGKNMVSQNLSKIEPNAKVINICEAVHAQNKDGYTCFVGVNIAGYDAQTVDNVFNEIVYANDKPIKAKVVGVEIKGIKTKI